MGTVNHGWRGEPAPGIFATRDPSQEFSRTNMRDLAIFGLLAAFLLAMPRRPQVGVYAWVIFSVMSPHRLTFGRAYSFPFAMVIATASIAVLLFTGNKNQKRELKGGVPGVLLCAFFAWMCLTTPLALEFDAAWEYLVGVSKSMLMTGVMLLLLDCRRHVQLLVWSLVVSLGLYGVKGGLFTIATGGQYHVNGPDGSVMEGNNALGVGLVVVIPLMMLLYQDSKNRWVRLGLGTSAALCAIAVLGTYSRGALLAIGAMSVLLWLRSSQKLTILLAVSAFVMVVIPAMPDQWTARMNTIETYQEDDSASFRLIAWETAFNIAKGRFPIGGGFEYNTPKTSARYSPVPELVMVAHSIYFQVIGSQGFVGIGLFIAFWLAVWGQCAGVRRRCRGIPELRWEFNTASMVQVAVVGYLVGGAFLNLAFWDLPYYVFAVGAVTKFTVDAHLKKHASPPGAQPMRPVQTMPYG